MNGEILRFKVNGTQLKGLFFSSDAEFYSVHYQRTVLGVNTKQYIKMFERKGSRVCQIVQKY